jgi:hypothetical protein
LEFDPDRFLDERLNKYLTPNPFIFLPFNAGPRTCPGQQVDSNSYWDNAHSDVLPLQFAYHEASYLLIRLLQAFSGISLARDAQPVDSLPPAAWATSGDHGKEKIWPKAHLSMFVEASAFLAEILECLDTNSGISPGWIMGSVPGGWQHRRALKDSSVVYIYVDLCISRRHIRS